MPGGRGQHLLRQPQLVEGAATPDHCGQCVSLESRAASGQLYAACCVKSGDTIMDWRSGGTGVREAAEGVAAGVAAELRVRARWPGPGDPCGGAGRQRRADRPVACAAQGADRTPWAVRHQAIGTGHLLLAEGLGGRFSQAVVEPGSAGFVDRSSGSQGREVAALVPA